MPIHEQTVYPNRNKFTIPNVCKTVSTTKAANAIIIAFASVMVLSFFILFNISNFGKQHGMSLIFFRILLAHFFVCLK